MSPPVSVGVPAPAVMGASSAAPGGGVPAAALPPVPPAAAGGCLLCSAGPWLGDRGALDPQASLKPAPREVEACLWADRRLVRAIVSAVDGEDGAVDLGDLPTSIR